MTHRPVTWGREPHNPLPPVRNKQFDEPFAPTTAKTRSGQARSRSRTESVEIFGASFGTPRAPSANQNHVPVDRENGRALPLLKSPRPPAGLSHAEVVHRLRKALDCGTTGSGRRRRPTKRRSTFKGLDEAFREELQVVLRENRVDTAPGNVELHQRARPPHDHKHESEGSLAQEWISRRVDLHEDIDAPSPRAVRASVAHAQAVHHAIDTAMNAGAHRPPVPVGNELSVSGSQPAYHQPEEERRGRGARGRGTAATPDVGEAQEASATLATRRGKTSEEEECWSRPMSRATATATSELDSEETSVDEDMPQENPQDGIARQAEGFCGWEVQVSSASDSDEAGRAHQMHSEHPATSPASTQPASAPAAPPAPAAPAAPPSQSIEVVEPPFINTVAASRSKHRTKQGRSQAVASRPAAAPAPPWGRLVVTSAKRGVETLTGKHAEWRTGHEVAMSVGEAYPDPDAVAMPVHIESVLVPGTTDQVVARARLTPATDDPTPSMMSAGYVAAPSADVATTPLRTSREGGGGGFGRCGDRDRDKETRDRESTARQQRRFSAQRTPYILTPQRLIPAPAHIVWSPPMERLEATSDMTVREVSNMDAQRHTARMAALNGASHSSGMVQVVYDGYSPVSLGGETRGLPRPFYVPTSPTDDTLVFESRFESGNLRRAVRVGPWEYDLVLQQDTNTNGRVQWFYFSVANVRAAENYKFNIVNLEKAESLYTRGMRVLMYSEQEAETCGVGWARAGTNVAYFPNTLDSRSRSLYTLSFTLRFPRADDRVYLANHYPYTLSDNLRHLESLTTDPHSSKHCRRSTLCKTLGRNNCDVITVTAGCDETSAWGHLVDDPPSLEYDDKLKRRRGVFLTSRVHPGEPGASWMLKGMLDFLTSKDPVARLLRLRFVFLIIPMLNPDGVVNGNYRCSLSGHDLNRQWQVPSPILHPTVYNAKMLLKRFCREREVVMFCDLHGHSHKDNIFIYGVNPKRKPAGPAKCRLFPKMLARGSETFRLESCSFKVKKNKEATARVVVAREFGVACSYTLESTFGGADFGALASVHFNTEHLEALGRQFCCTLLEMVESDEWGPPALRPRPTLRDDAPLRGPAAIAGAGVWTAFQSHDSWMRGR